MDLIKICKGYNIKGQDLILSPMGNAMPPRTDKHQDIRTMLQMSGMQVGGFRPELDFFKGEKK